MKRLIPGLATALASMACAGSDDASSDGAGANAGVAAGGSGNSGSAAMPGATGGGTKGKGGSSSNSAGSAGKVGASSGAGGADGDPSGPCKPDASAAVPARTLAGVWQKVELPDTFCGNGTPYKFFVNYSNDSNNLVMSFEPGGACWDYASCAGDGGLRGAANPDGIPDNHMSSLKWEMLPLHRRDPTNPISTWNMIFMPYCTGDLHTGNNVITYPNPDPAGQPLTFHHDGHKNVGRVIEWANQTFATIPQLLITGCSAGGTSSVVNYHFIRKGLTGAQCSYMLDDSGPLFPSGGWSGPLHQKVRDSWNLDPVIDEVISTDFPGVSPADVKADLSLINTALADKYPRDRLAIAMYRLDYNYSLYSYERFYEQHAQADIHRMWWEDIQSLMKVFETRPNLGYFIPFYRDDNCSHCMTIPPIDHDVLTILATPYLGSEIQEANLNVRDYVEHLVNDTEPLKSYLESEQAGEALAPERAAECSAL
jgi:hypothetical protein